MIDLPKKIKATGHNCVVASVVMVCMYWRRNRLSLKWNTPDDFTHQEWDKFYQRGLKYVKASGMPVNSIGRFLRSLNMPLNARLEYLRDSSYLVKLLEFNIPPIIIYNQDYYLKGERGIGHAAVLIDKTDESFVTVDPSFFPKGTHQIPTKDFEEAWDMEQKATIIICPKSVRFSREGAPSRTLDMYR